MYEKSFVYKTLIKELTERAAKEMGGEVASLIPLLIDDIIQEQCALGIDYFPAKTVKIPLTVKLNTPFSGKVYIGECTWDLRAKRKKPGFPPVEVDLAQGELEFSAAEESEEKLEERMSCDGEHEHGDEPDLWACLEDFANKNMYNLTRLLDPEATLPDAYGYLEIYKPSERHWERFFLGSYDAVAKTIDYAENNNAKSLVLSTIRDGKVVQPKTISLTEESVGKLLKNDVCVVDILPFRHIKNKDENVTCVECSIGADGKIRTIPVSTSTGWREVFKDLLLSGAVPMTFPWPPSHDHKAFH
ncbi:MAG: hypothetical protein ACI4SG_00655 [Oligosphaeraceae bacterium]